MIWIVVKISLALPTTHSFVESFLFISATQSYNLSKKVHSPFKNWNSNFALVLREKMIVSFLGMILLRNEPASLGFYVARRPFVGTLSISGALF